MKNQKRAKTPLALGIASIPLALMPVLGLPVGIIGLVLSSKAKRRNEEYAQAAFICSVIGLVLVVLNMAAGAYLGATGRI